MPLRMMTYLGLLYLDLYETKQFTKDKIMGYPELPPMRLFLCDLSLFTLGKRLLKHLLKNGLSLPLFFLVLSGMALE